MSLAPAAPLVRVPLLAWNELRHKDVVNIERAHLCALPMTSALTGRAADHRILQEVCMSVTLPDVRPAGPGASDSGESEAGTRVRVLQLIAAESADEHRQRGGQGSHAVPLVGPNPPLRRRPSRKDGP